MCYGIHGFRLGTSPETSTTSAVILYVLFVMYLLLCVCIARAGLLVLAMSIHNLDMRSPIAIIDPTRRASSAQS